jgi:hypothetical protein
MMELPQFLNAFLKSVLGDSVDVPIETGGATVLTKG